MSLSLSRRHTKNINHRQNYLLKMLKQKGKKKKEKRNLQLSHRTNGTTRSISIEHLDAVSGLVKLGLWTKQQQHQHQHNGNSLDDYLYTNSRGTQRGPINTVSVAT